MSLYTRFCDAKLGSSICWKDRNFILDIPLGGYRGNGPTHRRVRPVGIIKTEVLCWFLRGFGVGNSCEKRTWVSVLIHWTTVHRHMTCLSKGVSLRHAASAQALMPRSATLACNPLWAFPNKEESAAMSGMSFVSSMQTCPRRTTVHAFHCVRQTWQRGNQMRTLYLENCGLQVPCKCDKLDFYWPKTSWVRAVYWRGAEKWRSNLLG